MTGKLFPSGLRQNLITVPSPGSPAEVTVRTTLIDAANPFVFVDSSTLPTVYHQLGPQAPTSLDLIESIRRQGAVSMGLAPNAEAAACTRATPKIAIVASPSINTQHTDGGRYDDNDERQPDIKVTAFSMGKVHPGLQLTGAVCLGAATMIPGTVASGLFRRWSLGPRSDPPEKPPVMKVRVGGEVWDAVIVRGEVCIGHGGGKMLADVAVDPYEPSVREVTVDRTAQRLFEGQVIL